MDLRWLWVGLLTTLGACGDDEPDLAVFCERLALASAPTGAVSAVDLDDPDTIEAAVAELDALVDSSPEELRADVELMRDSFERLVEDLVSAPERGYDDVLRDHAEELDAATDASTRVEAFARNTCGVELAPAAEAPTPTPTPLSIQG